jgi:hypothetical protein
MSPRQIYHIDLLDLTSVAEKLDEEEEKIEAKNVNGAAADPDNDQEEDDDLSGEEEEEGDEDDEGGFLSTVVDQHWFQLGSRSSSGSGCKILQQEKINFFKLKNCNLFIPQGLQKELLTYGRSFHAQKRTSCTSKHEIWSFFNFSAFFALLDLDPHLQRGS